MQKSPIQWTDFTSNVIRARLKSGHDPAGGLGSGVGHWCQKISAGCANCYASNMQRRFGTPDFDSRNADLVEPFLDLEEMAAIKRRKKPALIFLSNMTDLFGDWVPDDWLIAIWKLMAACPQHTFQVLTKRPERMAEMTRSWRDQRGANLPNVWCGVSVENQETANQRGFPFVKVEADIKFVSYEPALGPIDWTGWELVQWIISGGESGSNARPSHPDWHRATRDFCESYGLSYFFKQWGEYSPPADFPDDIYEAWDAAGHGAAGSGDHDMMWKVGSRRSGRTLDGLEWNERPMTHLEATAIGLDLTPHRNRSSSGQISTSGGTP
jgi:protein gp37